MSGTVDLMRSYLIAMLIQRFYETVFVCVCVCVCDWERDGKHCLKLPCLTTEDSESRKGLIFHKKYSSGKNLMIKQLSC